MSESVANIWETYASSWKAETAEQKRAIFEQCLSQYCTYTDPLTHTTNWDELLTYMLDFHKQVAGGHFATTSFQHHHQDSIAHWEMRDATESKLGVGVSYGRYDEDGKIVRLVGFYELPGS